MCFVVSEQTEEKIGRRLFLAFDDSKPIKEEPKPGNSEVNTLSSLTSALYAKGVKEMCPPPLFFHCRIIFRFISAEGFSRLRIVAHQH